MRNLSRFVFLPLAALAFVTSPRAAEPKRPAAPSQSDREKQSFAEDDKILHSVNTGLIEYGDPEFAKRVRIAPEDKLVRVTQAPFHVGWPFDASCGGGAPPRTHEGHWIHVYVTHGAADVMIRGQGAYPKGTIILKEKFSDAAGTKADFYTGMRKREKGYSPGMGDWEFFLLNSYHVTARGRIESCMACHAKFKSTDFVSRRYLTGKEDLVW